MRPLPPSPAVANRVHVGYGIISIVLSSCFGPYRTTSAYGLVGARNGTQNEFQAENRNVFFFFYVETPNGVERIPSVSLERKFSIPKTGFGPSVFRPTGGRTLIT